MPALYRPRQISSIIKLEIIRPPHMVQDSCTLFTTVVHVIGTSSRSTSTHRCDKSSFKASSASDPPRHGEFLNTLDPSPNQGPQPNFRQAPLTYSATRIPSGDIPQLPGRQEFYDCVWRAYQTRISSLARQYYSRVNSEFGRKDRYRSRPAADRKALRDRDRPSANAGRVDNRPPPGNEAVSRKNPPPALQTGALHLGSTGRTPPRVSLQPRLPIILSEQSPGSRGHRTRIQPPAQQNGDRATGPPILNRRPQKTSKILDVILSLLVEQFRALRKCPISADPNLALRARQPMPGR